MVAENSKRNDLLNSAGVRRYNLISIVALFALLTALLEKNLGIWTLLPIVLGCISLILHVRFGPPLLIMIVGGMLLGVERNLDPISLIRAVFAGSISFEVGTTGSGFSDFIMSVAILVYCICFYRIQSIESHIFPLEPKRNWLFRKTQNMAIPQKRDPDLIDIHELAQIPLIGLLWSFVGLLLWTWLNRLSPWWGFSHGSWKSLVLFWLLGTGLILTKAVLSYLDFSRSDLLAQRISIQDILWLGTRGEQQKIHRMLTKKRLNRQNQKEKQ